MTLGIADIVAILLITIGPLKAAIVFATLTAGADAALRRAISMTSAIQQGTLTRSARRARIEELLAQIKQAEEEQIGATAVEQSRQNDQLRNVVDNMRGFGY